MGDDIKKRWSIFSLSPKEINTKIPNDGLEEIAFGVEALLIYLLIIVFSATALNRLLQLFLVVCFAMIGYLLIALMIRSIRGRSILKYSLCRNQDDSLQSQRRAESWEFSFIQFLPIVYIILLAPIYIYGNFDFEVYSSTTSMATLMSVFALKYGYMYRVKRYYFLGVAFLIMSILFANLGFTDAVSEMAMMYLSTGLFLIIVGSVVFLRFTRSTIDIEEKETHAN